MKNKDPFNLLKVLLFCSLLVLTAACFWPSLFNGFFCWDDKDVPLAPFVRQLNIQNTAKYFSTFHAGLYHPFTTLSFAIDYATGNGSAFPFHLTNLLLHLANTCLVFFLVRKLFSNFNMAFLVAILFGIHPMHVEAVAWITSRKDLLYVFFFLGALIAYVYFIDDGRKKKFWILSLVIFLFACLSKIQAAIFPVVLLLIDYLRNRKFSMKVVLEKIPFFIIAVVLGIINILAQKGYGYTDYKAPFSMIERMLIFCYGFAQYVFKVLVPVNISVFYPFPFRPGETLSVFYFLYPLILLIFLVVLFFIFLRSKKDLVFGLGLFFINIFLVLVISNYRETVITDRYTYLGSSGIFIFLAGSGLLAFRLMKRGKWILPSLGIFYIVALSWLTFKQTSLWKSPSRLIETALEHYPDSPILLNTLGTLAIDSGSYAKAMTYLDKAILLNKNYTDAWYHSGMAQSRLENFPSALEDFSQAIRINPAYTDAYFGRGNVYRITGDNQKALKEYSLVLMMNPNYFGAWQDRAIVKGNLNDYKGAIDDLNHAILLDPGFGASYYLRGIARFEVQVNGCDDLLKALQLNYQPAQKALDYYCR